MASHHGVEELRRLLTKYDYTEEHASFYQYGTAGFRYHAKELPPIMVRLGVAVALLQHHPVVGAMITASHNTAEYNGVKLAGTDGGMMDTTGEELVVSIVNERNIDQLLQKVMTRKNGGPRTVHTGRDTREHSPALSCLFQKALAAASGGMITLVDHGIVTTPQLHYAVQQGAAVAGYTRLPIVARTGVVLDYYEQLVQSYRTLLATAEEQHPLQTRTLTVDCACGVGFPHLVGLIERLEACGTPLPTRFVARNSPDAGPFLNEQCGSEFVQKQQQAPRWYDDGDSTADLSYCAAFDGDADRIVFFSAPNNSFTLLDGDKIACLIGNFLHEQLQVLPQLSLGVVQTAYANGASTAYLRDHQVNTTLAKTGVKYVHAAAHEMYDVGVYFEANGHGTVLFGNAFYSALHSCQPTTTQERLAILRLELLAHLINQAVGDALSDLLLVDVILHLTGSTVATWQALYTELPSQQTKVAVPDRSVVVTNETETRVLEPAGLQEAIDAAVAQYPSGRAFVRPSGTEDVVRIYAEASENVGGLAAAVQDAVLRFCARSKI